MKPTRMTQSQVPAIRAKMLAQGKGYCPLCLRPLTGKGAPDAVLDHCHDTGFLRDVLCRNCNGMEGRIMGYATRGALAGNDPVAYLERLVAYLKKHATPQSHVIHYTHKTEEEKREKRNKQQRLRRAKKAAKKD